MHEEHAFRILRLDPTFDGRRIRRNYTRLAKIYDAERFRGESAEVRRLAAALLDEATDAYEFLRGRRDELRAAVSANTPANDLWEEARRYRAARARRQQEAMQREARYQYWDQLEQAARERALREAELGTDLDEDDREIVLDAPAPAAPRASLQARLEQARRRERAAARDRARRA